MSRHRARRLSPQRGLGAVMAIVVLVILAGLAAAMLKFGTAQQLTSAQDVQSARAWSAARSGTEWGLYQALVAGNCSTAGVFPHTLNLSADTGFWVTVSCSEANPPATPYNEGESQSGTPVQVRVYTIEAIACSAPTAASTCPNDAAATSPGYVERARRVIATN